MSALSASSPEVTEVFFGRRPWAVVRADGRDLLARLAANGVDHIITDPPYSEHVHGKQRRMLRGSGGRTARGLAAGRGEVGPAELGFDALQPEVRAEVARQAARVCRRWFIAFSDAESVHAWEADLVEAGMRHIRVGAWVKVAGQPQLSGDRPAVGFEALEIAHGTRQRCRWSGGGLPAVWAFQIATDRNGTGERVHTTQKPLDLMLRLVEQFTDPGDLVVDPFAGSGTTGVACLRLGRRFLGAELDPTYAAVAHERLSAEAQGLTLSAVRAGQLPMFGARQDATPKRPTTDDPDLSHLFAEVAR